MGLCFINISPLNQRVKPIKSVLKGLDIRSIAHVVDDIWLISVDDEVNKKKGIVLYHESTESQRLIKETTPHFVYRIEKISNEKYLFEYTKGVNLLTAFTDV